MSENELAVDLGQAAAEMLQSNSNESSLPDPTAGDYSDTDIDVGPNSFWDDNGESDEAVSEPAESDEELGAVSEDDDVPSDSDSIITYKANGKEVTLDLASLRDDPKARQKLADDLALVAGAKKAVSKAGTLLSEKRKLEKERAELAEYKNAWDKLEKIREDEAKVFQVITGRSLDEVLAEKAEKSYKYQNASEEERKIMEYEDRIRQMEVSSQREAARRAKELEELNTKKYETDKRSVAADLKAEAMKYEFANVDEAKANRLQKMLWQSAIDDIKNYTKQGYKFNQKMITKAFRDNAAALEGFYKSSVSTGIKEATTKRQETAKEKAAAAATRNYKQPDLKDLLGKNPLEIFQAMRRRK